MNQFYLYDKARAGAYNQARQKPVQGLCLAQGAFLFFDY
jgi:hypothetical protein